MRPSRVLRQIAVILVLAFATASAEANNKLDIATGFYSLTGKTKTSSGSKSGIGAYRIGYRRSISPRVDLGLGYNLLYSSIVGGDAAFGLDVGLTYFPFGLSGMETYERNGQRLVLQPDFRPFVGFSFNQRNVQSVQTSYSGFGIAVGAEKTWNGSTSLTTTLRYNTLSGSKSATATIIDFLVGLAFGF